jgi:hypothetical protein
LKPDPASVAWLTLTVEPPELVSVTERLRLLPTCTLPNAKLVGLVVSAPGTLPTPLKGRLRLGFVASLVMATPPLADPPFLGANVTEKLTLCPAVKVAGSVSPLRLNPAPVATACETVTVFPPELVRVAV